MAVLKLDDQLLQVEDLYRQLFGKLQGLRFQLEGADGLRDEAGTHAGAVAGLMDAWHDAAVAFLSTPPA